jgi:hypothetical protein
MCPEWTQKTWRREWDSNSDVSNRTCKLHIPRCRGRHVCHKFPCGIAHHCPRAQGLTTRIPADQHQSATLYNSLIYIESKQSSCHSALRRKGLDYKTAEFEVLSPILLARIE